MNRATYLTKLSEHGFVMLYGAARDAFGEIEEALMRDEVAYCAPPRRFGVS